MVRLISLYEYTCFRMISSKNTYIYIVKFDKLGNSKKLSRLARSYIDERIWLFLKHFTVSFFHSQALCEATLTKSASEILTCNDLVNRTTYIFFICSFFNSILIHSSHYSLLLVKQNNTSIFYALRVEVYPICKLRFLCH